MTHPGMAMFLLRRLLHALLTLLGVVFLVFVLFNWVGGDPATLLAGKMASAEDIANVRHQLGLDLPLGSQFLLFLEQVVRGDYGESWATHERVSTIFWTRLGPSLTLLLPLLLLQTLLSLAVALLVAAWRGSWLDQGVRVVSTVAMSISLLVYIIVGQYWLAYVWGWFPVKGWSDSLGTNLSTYAVLPILLGLMVSIAPSVRLYRSFLLDEIDQDFVRTARAKGLSETRILWVHVLRNAAIPIVTDVLMGLPGLLTGAFLLEHFFAIPGIGREVIMAVERSDFPLIKATTVYVALATLLTNLLGDLLYRWLDPRVRLE